MQQTNRASDWIHEIDRATIRNVDAEADPRRCGNQTVRGSNRSNRFRVHGSDFFSMHLRGRDELHASATERRASRRVLRIQTPEGKFSVDLHVKSRSSLREAMADETDRRQRGESLQPEVRVHADPLTS